MMKISVWLPPALSLQVRERLRLIGYYDFVTTPVRAPGNTELLEWWGEYRDAERVGTCIQHVFSRAPGVTGLIIACRVESMLDLEPQPQ